LKQQHHIFAGQYIQFNSKSLRRWVLVFFAIN
jgi:hypothetical protein